MKKTIKLPWKKSFRKLPQRLRSKLDSLEGRKVRIACVKKIPHSHLVAGRYAHLGLTESNGMPAFSQDIVPDPRVGNYSRWNVHGREIVLRDRPMITREVSFETPNWGDWSNGSHVTSWDIEAYQREVISPKETGIQITLLRTDEVRGQKVYIVKFALNDVIDLSKKDAEAEAFRALNLLQENTGATDVFEADASDDTYLQTIHVDWEILPPGEEEDVVERVLRKYGNADEQVRQKVEARYHLLMALKPTAFINGTNGFRHYFGAMFADDLVVFENMEYGNAIYVMYEDWQELSKLSRIVLLKMKDKKVNRIVHAAGWEDHLIGLITEELHLRRIQDAAEKVKKEHAVKTAQNTAKPPTTPKSVRGSA